MQLLGDDIFNKKLEGRELTLEFSCGKIEESVYCKEVLEGSFHIYALSDKPARCFVYSTDARVLTTREEYFGTDIEVFYSFDSKNSESGDVIDGQFEIISDCGEYYIPFSINVIAMPIESSIGVIKNTFHFANLARTNFDEALALFYSENFQKIFIGSDYTYMDSYRALSARKLNAENVDEFLCSINKKKRIEYKFEYDHYSMDIYPEDEGLIETTVTIIKEGWGYAALDIECNGDFVYPERTHISEENFVRNKCNLVLFVDSQRVNVGDNHATLTIKNGLFKLDTQIQVHCTDKNFSKKTVKSERLLIALLDNFCTWKMGKISLQSWLRRAEDIVEEQAVNDPESLYVKLFSAHILILKERTNEAGWSLEHTYDLYDKAGIEDPLFRTYYLYLSSLLKQDEEYRRAAVAEAKAIFKMNSDNWKIGWFLLFDDFDIESTPEDKWNFVKRMYAKGCTSPLYYGAAVNALDDNPMLLRTIDSFSRQIIAFGAKKDALSKECIERVAELCSKIKNYDQLLMMSLKRLYKLNSDERILISLCEMALQTQATDTSMFVWYEKAIKSGVKLPNLYENYMLSMDTEKKHVIPKEVLIYFSYRHYLPVKNSAYLYSYVCEHKDEYMDLYPVYAANLDAFLTEQLRNPEMDANLIKLYDEVLSPAFVNEKNATALSKIIYMSRIVVENKSLVKMYIYHENIIDPEVFNIVDGVAFAPIYSADKCICFEDERGKRYIKGIEYTIEKLLIPGKYLYLFDKYSVNSIYFNIDIRGIEANVTEDNVGSYIVLSMSSQVTPSFRRKLCGHVIEYLFSNEMYEELDEYMEFWSSLELDAELKAIFLRVYVLRGYLDKAMKFVEDYSFYYAEERVLVKLVALFTARYGNVQNYNILKIAEHVFEGGKKDEEIVTYLVVNTGGLLKKLRDVYQAALRYDIELSKLAEGIIVQLLFSNAYISERGEIFEYYLAHNFDERVRNAYLKNSCFDYFVNEKIVEKLVFEETEKLILGGRELDIVGKLAMLKAYAEGILEITDENRSFIRSFMAQMVAMRIYQKFFLKIDCCFDITVSMKDKVIIEYRTNPGTKTRIHYCLEREGYGESDYCAEYMRELVNGIFFMPIVLFYGESLQYYIIEETDGEEILTESGTLQMGDGVVREAATRFDLLNDMLLSDSIQDFDTFEKLMEEFVENDYMSNALFKLV